MLGDWNPCVGDGVNKIPLHLALVAIKYGGRLVLNADIQVGVFCGNKNETKLEPPGSISSKAKRSVNKTYNKKDRLNSKSKVKIPKKEQNMNITFRLEQPQDYYTVEALTRDAFWKTQWGGGIRV